MSQIEHFLPHEGRLVGEDEISTQDHDYKLLGMHCKSCNAKFFPVNTMCLFCLSESVEKIPLSTEGNLYSYSFIHIAPKQWKVPYGIGYVDLPEGVRIFGKLEDTEPAHWKVDAKVYIQVKECAKIEGQPTQYQYFFKSSKG
jgi:uncharacterized OB-fold protein